MNKGLRRFLALALAGTMVFGCTMTAFASEATGEGTYEGGELKYPELAVTLPTIPEDTYDYIADPNGLIAETDAAKYSGCTFSETAQGIFFLTSEKTYTEKSAALTASNENAQDVDFTVKLEQSVAGDASITYSSTATFEDGDTANKIYLAVTDETNTVALTDTVAAVLTTTVEGTPDNFEASYSADTGYGYTKKSGDLTWNDYSFYMTGVLNMNATWGDDLTFPTIKVTWSYAEHTDAPTVPTVSATSIANNGGSVDITLPEGVTITEIQKSKADGTFNTLPTTYYTLVNSENGQSLTLADVLKQYTTTSIKIIFSEGDPITLTITE